MSIKVRILIGVDGIAPPEMAAPVGSHHEERSAQPSRVKLGRIQRETFQVWLTLVGVV